MKNKIKALMQLTNTTQIDLANKLGVSQSYISHLIALSERGRIEDIRKIVESAGGKLEVSIVLPDGTKI